MTGSAITSARILYSGRVVRLSKMYGGRPSTANRGLVTLLQPGGTRVPCLSTCHAGFPSAITTVATKMYESCRIISLQGGVRSAGFASRGVAAGFGIATMFVQVYGQSSWDELLRICPKLNLYGFNDDAGLLFNGPSVRDLLQDTHAGAQKALEVIEGQLECEVSQPKAAVIVFSQALVRPVRRIFGAARDRALLSV